MARLIAVRLVVSLFTLWLVSVLVFVGTEFLPGDVVEAVLGQSATPDTVEALRRDLGLNAPAPQRYLDWLLGFVNGDLGKSLATGVPIAQLISERLVNTLMLGGAAAALVVPVAVGLGVLSAMYPDSLLDRAISLGSLFLVSMPEFLLGSILVVVFSVNLKWFPAVAYVTEYRSVGHFLATTTLPLLTLSGVLLAQMIRMTRASILNIMGSAYIEMAVLKGTRRWKIVVRHALVNAIGPIGNVVALNVAFMVSGIVIVETIFGYPGLAKLTVDAVATRDFPLVQSCALIFCSAYIVFMLLADVLAILSNPRLRHPSG